MTVMQQLKKIGFRDEELHPLPEDFKGMLVVLRPSAHKPEFRTRKDLVVRAIEGFGCRLKSRGSAVFVQSLVIDGGGRYDRSDIVCLYNGPRDPAWGEYPREPEEPHKFDPAKSTNTDCPEDEASPRLGQCAAWAQTALVEFANAMKEPLTPGDGPDLDPETEDKVKDLITDLLHFCDSKGFDTEAVARVGVNNWRAER